MVPGLSSGVVSRDPIFSLLSRTPTCNRQTWHRTQGHSIYHASIASRGKYTRTSKRRQAAGIPATCYRPTHPGTEGTAEGKKKGRRREGRGNGGKLEKKRRGIERDSKGKQGREKEGWKGEKGMKGRKGRGGEGKGKRGKGTRGKGKGKDEGKEKSELVGQGKDTKWKRRRKQRKGGSAGERMRFARTNLVQISAWSVHNIATSREDENPPKMPLFRLRAPAIQRYQTRQSRVMKLYRSVKRVTCRQTTAACVYRI